MNPLNHLFKYIGSLTRKADEGNKDVAYTRTANQWFLVDLISPVAGDSDELYDIYGSTNIDDEAAAKGIIRAEFKPYFNGLTQEYQRAMKLSLSYYLTTDAVDFRRIIDGSLMPFKSPANPKLFFVWIWEVLFPGEDYLMHDHKNIKDSNDFSGYEYFKGFKRTLTSH